MAKRSAAFSCAAVGFLGSCLPEVSQDPPFRIVRFTQSGAEQVCLNEKLVFRCSDWVDPFSITRESLSIVGEDGEPARGRYFVRPHEIEFLPEPVFDPMLSGGGFRPATNYEVRVAGFPRLGGLRSVKGTPLESSVGFRFRTIDPERLPTGIRSPFLDERPGEVFGIRDYPRTPKLGEPLRFEFTKPVRPDSLRRTVFRMIEGAQPSAQETQIPVQATLKANAETGLIELRPDWGLVRAEAVYRVEIDPAKLLDFGGSALSAVYFTEGRPVFSFRFVP